MKIHQTNYNINDKRLVISKPCLHLKLIWSENQLQIAASLILTDKSLSTETPTLSLLMENKQWLNGEFFEMWRDVLQEQYTRCLITAEKIKGGRNKEPLHMRDHPHAGQNPTYTSQGLSVDSNQGQLTWLVLQNHLI